MLAIALSVLVIYRVVEPRLNPGGAIAGALPKGRYQSVRISDGLEPHVRAVVGPLPRRNPGDLVTPLTTLRKRFSDRRQTSDRSMHEIFVATDEALAQMLVAAELKTKLAHEVVRIGSKPSPLETRSSSTSSANFFAEQVVARWDQQRKPHELAVGQKLNRLRDEEQRYEQKSRRVPLVEGQIFDVSVRAIRARSSGSPLDRRAY